MKKNMQKNESAAHASPFASTPLIFILMLWTLLYTGCASWPAPTRSAHVGGTGPLGSCADFFASLDGLAAAADAVDPGYSRVKRHPYLRTDRFLASFQEDVKDDHTFTAWVGHMQALDQSARLFELANLSDADIAAMHPSDGRDALYRKVVACGNRLKNDDLLHGGIKARRHMAVSVKGEYIPLRQVLGLYPLTRVFVSRGVKKWHAEAREGFSTAPPADWQPVRYVPATDPDAGMAHRLIRVRERDALGIPIYSARDRRALFKGYAPIWEIQQQSDADRIGSPVWNAKGRIEVDTDRPRTFTLLSFSRFGKTILTQLNYIIWFPARPRGGVFDLYAGRLDGLNYRVTVDEDGSPILYETMHNCGCYYKAYPTRRLQVRESTDYQEAPLILKAPEMRPALEMMVVGMAHRTHYVRTLYTVSRGVEDEAGAYTLADYGELKRLPQVDGGSKSMFDRYGLVPGSQRLERFFLWPTGVLSPGAMRQWGRHAVAFVGERHFDDPFYLDKMFVARP
ncbi:hypothetical protein [Desulfosarcina sp.]|uniref:hypothetical protein n=1 Tax=Desulfosarcina sp. TaxID=2027861 RepID=UPI003567E827